ncbi:MAG: hypothetical protein IPK06_09895 [Ignavibacteriae bacterium]|nr:hypothetical protein [Ignavibacteriota bacterium]
MVKNYKPYLLSGTNYNYDPNYLTNSNNYYTGGLGAYDNYCATNGRPYYEMKYFDDPLHRTDEETPEGTSWASHKISHDYAGNESNYIQYATGTYYTQNSLYKNILTNENGIINWNYTDKFNNLILTVENPTGLNLKTQFKYDILGNQIEKKDPSSLIINYKYNPIKQLIEQTSPDAGTTRYLYDKNGNIRFKRHADQITTSNNTYRSSSYMYSPTTVTGTFSLVTPTMLKVRALATSTGFYATTTVKIKNSDGLYQFLEVKAESNGNTDVTKYIRLPKGSYKWETITAGSGPITFFYDVDTRYIYGI